jgi:hypothetical protein
MEWVGKLGLETMPPRRDRTHEDASPTSGRVRKRRKCPGM